jgi:hypothetical protein
MVFCMDNVEYSAEISVIISQMIKQAGVEQQSLLAHIHLVSDLLHNSTLPSQKCFW